MVGKTFVAIEIDEKGHKYNDKKDEEIRYDDLYMIFSGKWIWIRFNPDPIPKKDNIDLCDKINILIEMIHNQIERIENEENTELCEIIKLFF
jgi:hypothetical protein